MSHLRNVTDHDLMAELERRVHVQDTPQAGTVGLGFGIGLDAILKLLLPLLEKKVTELAGAKALAKILHVFFKTKVGKEAAQAAEVGAIYEIPEADFHDYGRNYGVNVVDKGKREHAA